MQRNQPFIFEGRAIPQAECPDKRSCLIPRMKKSSKHCETVSLMFSWMRSRWIHKRNCEFVGWYCVEENRKSFSVTVDRSFHGARKCVEIRGLKVIFNNMSNMSIMLVLREPSYMRDHKLLSSFVFLNITRTVLMCLFRLPHH